MLWRATVVILGAGTAALAGTKSAPGDHATISTVVRTSFSTGSLTSVVGSVLGGILGGGE